MRRVALATLRHDALRSSLLVAGLATAWSLVTVQLGLRRGFELSSRAILDHAGGDVWIAAPGVKVIDDGEPVAAASVTDVAHPCIVGRRPIIVDYTQARRPDGSLVTVQVVGVDAASRGRVPWAVAAGEREELERSAAAGIDEADAGKLGLARDGMGQEIRLRSGAVLRVGVVSRGARNFTQTPYLFLDIAGWRGGSCRSPTTPRPSGRSISAIRGARRRSRERSVARPWRRRRATSSRGARARTGSRARASARC